MARVGALRPGPRRRSAPGCSPSCATSSSTWRGPGAPASAGRGDAPAEGVARDDEHRPHLTTWQVEAALAELDDDHRQVLVEVHWRGRPYAEVADELGIPDGHGEEPRVLRAARHAQRARGAGVARWLSARSPAPSGRRTWPAGCGPAPPERGGRAGRAPRDLRACRAEADSLLGGGRRHCSAPTRRRAAAARLRERTAISRPPTSATASSRRVARRAPSGRSVRVGLAPPPRPPLSSPRSWSCARPRAGPAPAGSAVAVRRACPRGPTSSRAGADGGGSLVAARRHRPRPRHHLRAVAHRRRAAPTRTGSPPARSAPTTTAGRRAASAAPARPTRCGRVWATTPEGEIALDTKH